MLKTTIKNILRKTGYEIIKAGNEDQFIDMEDQFKQYYEQCSTFTRTSIHRMYAIYKAVEYIITNNIEGDLVECGTWRGGSAMMMALALIGLNEQSRKIYLYDTFEGMTEPTEKDVTYANKDASSLLSISEDNKEDSVWCLATIEEVQNNLFATGYPKENLLFIKGKVEETIPANMPLKISLLRLDTDWYESTRHELVHLYPLLTEKGVIIIDDYGHWKGAREATDEYFKKTKQSILLNRIDYTGRIGVKS
jgi:hypothetical protein